jgi:hypothetical protein
MTTTVTALYDSYEDATRTLRDLEAAGIAHGDVSVVSNRNDQAHTDLDDDGAGRTATKTGKGAGTGATIGTVLGGGAGLLAGLGIMAIPGIGPVVAAGWLVSTAVGAAAGAAAGGIIGALTGAGVSEEDAQVYAEGVRRGGTLLITRVEPGRVAVVRGIMQGNNAVDINVRRDTYRQEGWERFDANAEPLTDSDLRRTQSPSARL